MVITTAILTNFFSLIKIGKNRQNVVVKAKLHLKQLFTNFFPPLVTFGNIKESRFEGGWDGRVSICFMIHQRVG